MKSEREKMLAGELYDPMDPELVAARVRARGLCQELNATREGGARRTAAHPARVVQRRRPGQSWSAFALKQHCAWEVSAQHLRPCAQQQARREVKWRWPA
jgi:Maltose acetyltransferase